jgi:hypothetical protein
MTTPARTPGTYGRNPRDPSRFCLTLESYVYPQNAVELPPVAYNVDVDYATKVASWPMYCNGPDPENAVLCPGSPNGAGDCTCAAFGHMIQSWTAYAGTEITVPAKDIIAMYSAISGYDPQTGANDNGCDMQTVLEYMRNTGLPDGAGTVHKVAGYARFGDPTNEALLATVLNAFGTVYIGANIQQAQEQQFSAGEPWAYVAGSAVVGGHAICLQQRRGTGTAKLEDVTWGALQPAATSFQQYCVDEAYAVVSQDFIDAHGTTVEGLDLAQLLADMSQVS